MRLARAVRASVGRVGEERSREVDMLRGRSWWGGSSSGGEEGVEGDEACFGDGLDGGAVGGGDVGGCDVGLGVGRDGRSWDWERASSWEIVSSRERRLGLVNDILGI